MSICGGLYHVQKVTSIIKVKCFVKKDISPWWNWICFFSSMMTLNMFIFTFFFAMLWTVPILGPKYFRCPLAWSDLISYLSYLSFGVCYQLLNTEIMMNMKLFRNTEAGIIYLSNRPQPWRDRNNQCSFPRPSAQFTQKHHRWINEAVCLRTALTPRFFLGPLS